MTSPMKSFNHCNDLQCLPEAATFFLPSFLNTLCITYSLPNTMNLLQFCEVHLCHPNKVFPGHFFLLETPFAQYALVMQINLLDVTSKFEVCFFLLQHFQTLKILHKSLSLLPDFLQKIALHNFRKSSLSHDLYYVPFLASYKQYEARIIFVLLPILNPYVVAYYLA